MADNPPAELQHHDLEKSEFFLKIMATRDKCIESLMKLQGTILQENPSAAAIQLKLVQLLENARALELVLYQDMQEAEAEATPDPQ